MPSFHRQVHTRTTPSRRGQLQATARVDDFFHGFEVQLEVRDGEVVGSEATTHRHPWTTCPGALASVGTVRGPASYAATTVNRLPRSTTCVHLNDLVWLAAMQHVERTYEIEVTPFVATLARDGAHLLTWQLHQWTISGDGPFAGLIPVGSGWPAALDRIGVTGADPELREAVRVLRRGVLVAIGYYTLEWRSIERGADVPREIMADTCHTFSPGQVESTVCLAATPDRRGRPR